ncbi:MAG: rRNA methyltransferase, partial [Rubrivivax sp.]|nr:rRNA methyltransferase [Rubrivivax sp.]
MPTRVAEMRERLRALGAQPVHERHLLRRWLHAQSLDGGRRDVDHFLPKALRQALPELAAEWDALARLDLELPAPDGGARLR